MNKNNCTLGDLFWSSLTPFLLWIGISPCALALTPEVIDFQTLGYNRSIVLKGVNPELEISVPAPKGGLETKSSFVRLHLEPSSLLNENSSVRLLVYGEPVKVILVKTLQSNPIVTLPLPPVPPGESFINLSIQSHLFISNDSRQDLPTGNLFLKVGKDSFFQVTPRFLDNSIDGFFKSFYSQVNLLVPSKLNQAEAEVALWLYSVLAYQFREHQIPIFWRRGQAQAPVVGSASVILHTEPTGPDIERRGSTLRVRANPRAIQALTAEFYQPALVSGGLTVEAIDPFDPKPIDQARSFKELGFKDRPLRVSGTQAFPLKFDLAQLGGRPKDLDLVLNATFTPVGGKQGDHLTAQVYLNNTLVQAYNLTDKTVLKTTLSLPGTQLLRSNNLEILFSHIRSEENSQLGTTGETIIQVHGDSYLNWNGYEGPTGQLSDLPHVFLKPGQLIVDTRQPALLAATAYFLGVTSRLGQQPVFPQLIAAQSIKDWSNLPQQNNKPPAWRLLALPPQMASLPAPVRLNQSFFEIYNPVNQQRLLKAQPTDPFGIMQYFSYKGTPTLWLSWWGLKAEMAELLGQALGDPRTLLATQLDGNVITATDVRRVQIWDLGDRTLQVTYPEERNWQILVQRYNNLLIIVSLILGGVIAWRVYLRTGRPQVAPASPSKPVEKTKEL